MRKFIELRFGQGGWGPDNLVQREIVPIKAIKNAFVILPEKRNISITFENAGRLFSRTEYYKNEIDCIKRWCFLKKACGMSSRDNEINPVPLAMDVDELKEVEQDGIPGNIHNQQGLQTENPCVLQEGI